VQPPQHTGGPDKPDLFWYYYTDWREYQQIVNTRTIPSVRVAFMGAGVVVSPLDPSRKEQWILKHREARGKAFTTQKHIEFFFQIPRDAVQKPECISKVTWVGPGPWACILPLESLQLPRGTRCGSRADWPNVYNVGEGPDVSHRENPEQEQATTCAVQ
jgi:hypothetical protein